MEYPGRAAGETAAHGNKLPQMWFGSAAEKLFKGRLAGAPQRTLLLDYDGTLAPFHTDKTKALPYPGVAELLEELNRRGDTRIVLVTGRPANDLPELIDVAKKVEIWGSHGREHIDRDRRYSFFSPTPEQSATLARLREEIESGLRDIPLTLDVENLTIKSHGSQANMEAPEPLEVKPASIAIHWRGLAVESQELLRNRAEVSYHLHANAGIERLPFESGLEFRATGCTKAFAVRQVIERSGDDCLIAYLGDDLTDEDAFAALNTRGDSLLVRVEPRPSHARYWLKPPDELIRFFESWL